MFVKILDLGEKPPRGYRVVGRTTIFEGEGRSRNRRTKLRAVLLGFGWLLGKE